jgi:hypothetical protein
MKKKLFLATPALLLYFAMQQLKLHKLFAANIQAVL